MDIIASVKSFAWESLLTGVGSCRCLNAKRWEPNCKKNTFLTGTALGTLLGGRAKGKPKETPPQWVPLL